ncbi:serine protein kinase PrkA, partial [Halobacteriales archaeon QS_9_70_65]
MSNMESLEELSKEYRNSIPSDLRETRSFDWYLEYDEEAGVVEYELASEDPLGDGENTFYGRVIHEAIHEFINKVKSGARGLGPEKRIKLLLGPVGSGKSDFDRQIRRYFEDYTTRREGRMYTFRWTGLCDVLPDQDPADDVVRSPMNQDPIVLLPQEQRDAVIEDINAAFDAPYTIRNEQALDPASEFYMDALLEHYDDDLQTVLETHVEVVRLLADENKRQAIETFEP